MAAVIIPVARLLGRFFAAFLSFRGVGFLLGRLLFFRSFLSGLFLLFLGRLFLLGSGFGILILCLGFPAATGTGFALLALLGDFLSCFFFLLLYHSLGAVAETDGIQPDRLILGLFPADTLAA